MAHLGLSRRTLARIAENRIQRAMEEGELDELPGKGKPIPGIDQPYDPLWWVRSWIQRERLTELPRRESRHAALQEILAHRRRQSD